MVSANDTFRVAERAGALGGFVLGSLTLAQLALALAGLNADAQQALGGVALVADFATFFMVGLVVRRRAGLVEAGMRAGLLSGTVAGAMAAVGTSTLAVLAPRVDASMAMEMAPAARGVGATLFAGLVNLAVLATIGAGMAIAGALAVRPKTTTAIHSPMRLRGRLDR